MGEHLIDGEFQSDKYPWCKRKFIPLKISVNDPSALKVLREYAELRRPIDPEFSDDLLEAIRIEEAKSKNGESANEPAFDEAVGNGVHVRVSRFLGPEPLEATEPSWQLSISDATMCVVLFRGKKWQCKGRAEMVVSFFKLVAPNS